MCSCRLQVSVLRFSVGSVGALGSDGNTLLPKIHRADSNGSPQVQGGGGGSQPGGSVAIAPSSERRMSRFFVWLLPCCGSAPCPLRVSPLVEASGSTDYILPSITLEDD